MLFPWKFRGPGICFLINTVNESSIQETLGVCPNVSSDQRSGVYPGWRVKGGFTEEVIAK